MFPEKRSICRRGEELPTEKRAVEKGVEEPMERMPRNEEVPVGEETVS